MDLAQKKFLYYSLDPNVTVGQLKSLEHCEIDPQKEQQLLKRMETHQVSALSQEMECYPVRFLQMPSAPYVIYAVGDLSLLSRTILGIVGPRMMSPYADSVMEALFDSAKSYDVVTVSGLARGVDQKCHQLSLQYALPTIAVLGGGLRRYSLRRDRRLIREIVDAGGLVLSEFKLDFEPTTWSFPQRNRIIAGLSDYLFLPEAKEGSGSLITVDFALKMKKKVFVAPNQLFSANGGGSNHLISQGKVSLLTDFEQLLGAFVPKVREKSVVLNDLTPRERELVDLIAAHPEQEFSAWISQVVWDFGEALSQLTLLEMKGVIVQRSPGFYFVR